MKLREQLAKLRENIEIIEDVNTNQRVAINMYKHLARLTVKSLEDIDVEGAMRACKNILELIERNRFRREITQYCKNESEKLCIFEAESS